MAAQFWSNVKVDVQSALGGALPVTAVTKANPAVATSAAHGLVNGDIVVFGDVVGMAELSNRAFRVAGVATNTFQLEAEDSTGYGTFTSGSANKVTGFVSMNTVTGVTASGGDPEFADVTTIHDTIRKQVPTVVSPLQYSLESLFDVADPALVELNKAFQTTSKRVFRLRFAGLNQIVGNCYAAAPLVPTGNAQEAVKTPITLSVQGIPKAYAT